MLSLGMDNLTAEDLKEAYFKAIQTRPFNVDMFEKMLSILKQKKGSNASFPIPDPR